MSESKIQIVDGLPAGGPFSEVMPGLQLVWDSTSLGWFKKCPTYYFNTMMQGWRRTGTNVHLEFGIAFHSALEAFDKAIVAGKSHDEAADVAVAFALNSGFKGDDKFKNLPNLVRSIVWYAEHYKDDRCKTYILPDGTPAVELTFRFSTGVKSPTGEEYELGGHIDRIVEMDDGLWVADRKTTKASLDQRYFRQYSPDNQMSLYSLASQVIYKTPVKGVMIDAIHVNQNFNRFHRDFTFRTTPQLQEWTQDAIYYMQEAARLLQSRFYPMNDKSCHAGFFPCDMFEICSKDPAVRQAFMETDFGVERWDPTVARE